MNFKSAPIRADARAILRLGGPLIVNNLANTGMTFADTVMAGQLGARELAGLAVGVSFYHLAFLIGLGVLMSLAPTVAHAFGAREHEKIGGYVRQSVWLVVAVSIVMMAVMWQARWVFSAIGIDPQILPIAADYCSVVAWGLPGFFLFLALRFASEGLGRTTPIMYIGLTGLCVNVFGNWVLAFGKLGAPALGTTGLAIATVITMWFMFFGLLIYMWLHRSYREYAIFRRIERPNMQALRELLKIGMPIAGSLLCEGGLFIVAAMLMGTMGAVIAGAHQIALNYASIMFMMPLALHSATTVYVGHRLGAGEGVDARRAGFVGIAMCGVIMALSAVAIFLFNEQIAWIYTQDARVRELAATLLLMAAVFQVSDGLQVGAAGALRGFKDTAIPLAICFVSYWLIGFPFAYITGVVQAGGPVYVWLGLVIGLSAAAVLLNVRYHLLSRRALGTNASLAESAFTH